MSGTYSFVYWARLKRSPSPRQKTITVDAEIVKLLKRIHPKGCLLKIKIECVLPGQIGKKARKK